MKDTKIEEKIDWYSLKTDLDMIRDRQQWHEMAIIWLLIFTVFIFGIVGFLCLKPEITLTSLWP